MRIAIYSPTFYPVIDGTSIQSKRQVDLLSKDYDVRGISFLVDREIKECKMLEEVEDGIIRIKPTYSDSPKKRFPSLKGENIVNELHKFSPDVIHLRGWYQFQVLNDVIESYGNTKTKLYWHADGLHECHDKFNQDPKYKELIQKAIDSRVIVVGHTDYDLEILSQMGLEKNQYEQIPPLLDNKLISKKKNWSNPRLLSLARFFDYKRHEDVFDATKQVDKNLEVILAGSSDSEYSLGIITRLNEKGASLILNPSSLMVNDLYNLATHFVLASNKETLGIAALEATVSGCIPLVKRNKGIISYLPEQFIFDNLIELKEKLSYSINPEVSKILASELKELRIKLSLENIKLEFEKSYRRRI